MGDDAIRQGAIDFLKALGHALGDHAAVFTRQHEHRSEHHLLAIRSGGTGAEFLAEIHFGDLSKRDRKIVAGGDDDATDGFKILKLAGGADEILFAIALNESGPDIGVILFEGLHDFVNTEIVGQHELGIGSHMELFLIAADCVDFHDTGDVAQLWFDHPVLDGAKVGGRDGRAIGIFRPGLRLHGEHEDLTQAGGDGAHRRIDFGRQLAFDLLQSLGHELACEELVRAILEDDRHLR